MATIAGVSRLHQFPQRIAIVERAEVDHGRNLIPGMSARWPVSPVSNLPVAPS
jgi:hypothetical protein